MLTVKTLDDAHAIQACITAHPISGMTRPEVRREFRYLNELLRESVWSEQKRLQAEENGKPQFDAILVGVGLLIALAGIISLQFNPVVGSSITIAGACTEVMSLANYLAGCFQKRELARALTMAHARYEELKAAL